MSETNQVNVDSAIPRRGPRGRVIRMLALAAVLFICGGAAGWGMAILTHHRPPPGGPMGMGPDVPVDAMIGQLREELLLSDDQAKQVRQIYKDREDALHSIRQKMEPELKSEYDKLDGQMKGVLNSAQYERWHERFQNVRSRMLPPPPRPDGNGPPPPQWNGPDGPGPGGDRPGGPGGPGHGPPPGPPDGMPPP